MDARIIRSEEQYENTLAEIERLVTSDPPSGSEDAERLELLAVLVADFERVQFPISRPTPIEALLFRMDQLGWTQRDLVPFVGSRSKVSEILSGKRTLTLPMIRALHDGLGIPLEVLVQEPPTGPAPAGEHTWDGALVREMEKRGWNVPSVTRHVSEFASRLLLSPQVHMKTGQVVRSARSMDQNALLAWTGRVVEQAAQASLKGKFRSGTVTAEFLRQLGQLSWAKDGPLLAREFLDRHGITVIIEPHLPRTYVDGAALLSTVGTPIVALTLRHDRIDNFWFTLLHELIHVRDHLRVPGDVFVDDLDYEESEDLREIDADNAAGEALIPEVEWHRFNARGRFVPEAIEAFAVHLHIHPAIVAGRIRRMRRNYRLLSGLVGQGQVRKLFGSVGQE